MSRTKHCSTAFRKHVLPLSDVPCVYVCVCETYSVVGADGSGVVVVGDGCGCVRDSETHAEGESDLDTGTGTGTGIQAHRHREGTDTGTGTGTVVHRSTLSFCVQVVQSHTRRHHTCSRPEKC